MKTLQIVVNGVAEETFEAEMIFQYDTSIIGKSYAGATVFEIIGIDDMSIFKLSGDDEFDIFDGLGPNEDEGKIKLNETDELGFLSEKIGDGLVIGTDDKLEIEATVLSDLKNIKKRFKVEHATLYFSDVAGNDNLDGTTFATAKKSVQKFLEKINQSELYSDGSITKLSLRLLTNEGGPIILNGIQGLSLLIASNTGHAPVSELKVINCSNAITLMRLDPQSEVRIMNCRNVSCNNLHSTTTTGSGFYIAEGSKVYLEGCKISGAEDGIYASEFSDVMSLNFIGKGTDTGVTSANGSQVRVSGATIRGDKSNTIEISGGTVTYI